MSRRIKAAADPGHEYRGSPGDADHRLRTVDLDNNDRYLVVIGVITNQSYILDIYSHTDNFFFIIEFELLRTLYIILQYYVFYITITIVMLLKRWKIFGFSDFYIVTMNTIFINYLCTCWYLIFFLQF